MSEYIIHSTGKLQDRQIVKLFGDIKDAFGEKESKYLFGKVVLDTVVGVLLDGVQSYCISDAEIHSANNEFRVFYRRGASALHSNGVIDINSRVPSPYFDEIIISTGGQNNNPQNKAPSPRQCLQMDAIISRYASSHVPKSVDAGAKGAIDLLQKEMADLAAFHKKMLEDAEQQRLALEAEFRRKHAELEEKHAADERIISDLSEKEKKGILVLRQDLEKAQKLLDDRDHMHVRRDLREKINNEIKERVSKTLLPPKTIWMNGGIVAFTLICAAVAGVVAYGSYASFTDIIKYQSDPSQPKLEHATWLIVAMAIRGTVASIVTLGFLVYGLSWMKKTYVDNVNTSNDLQKYALDINRASWTIETIMEMTTKEGRVLPDKWIEGVCYGLFKKSDCEKAEITPLDAWGALLNVSGKVEYGPDGPKLEFNKAQARKLAKPSDE